MLGPDRFAFETPNVIDPGDLPPSQPSRPDQPLAETLRSNMNGGTQSDGGSGKTTHSDDESSQVSLQTLPSSNRYHDERSARLLRDSADLDLSPPTEPYDPYRNHQDDDEGDDDDDLEGAAADNNKHHSLPSVDEARLYAASLLQDSKRRGGRDFQRTIKLRLPTLGKSRTAPSDHNPHRHVLRRQLMRYSRKFLIVIVVLVVIIVIAVTVRNKHEAARNASPTTQNADSQKMNAHIKGINTQKRKEDIIAFLIDQSVTSHYDLDDPNTPQSKAVDWLAQYDLLVRPVPTKVHSRQRFVQRYALATLYYALSGEEWTKKYKFLSSEDECGWFEEVPVSNYAAQDTAFGITCDPNLAVQSLFVPDNNLTGSLPSELRFLSSLDMIALPNNAVRGTIPREFHSWTNLRYIDLKYNRISGMLPSWIGDFSKLEVLGLSNNEFAGGVPANFGSLGRLKTLAVDDNALTGDLDWANHLTNLQYFYGERNSFTGQVDSNFLSNLLHLNELDLSSTALSGKDLPLHLLDHPSLEVLDLSYNIITGSLPEIPNVNKVLKYLSLRHCNMTGTIPRSMRQLQGLDHLDLNGNLFAGTIPNILGQMTNLKYLFLGSNNFTETSEMPPLLSQLTLLRELAIDSSNLGGTIPSWMAYLEFLTLLNLSSNRLTGTIPQAIWDLPKLSFLLLHNNQLSGQIPSQVQIASNIQVLTLFENSFTGNVSYFCAANPEVALVAPDCTVACDPSCCKKCCKAGEMECFRTELPMYLSGYEGMWEYGFDRASYSFDPVILESGLVSTQAGLNGTPPQLVVGDNFQYPVDQTPNKYLPEPVDPTVTMQNFTAPNGGGGSP
jgi:Leucine-rich repeat (LRR) protein